MKAASDKAIKAAKVGDFIAMNLLSDAVFFEITEIHHFGFTIREGVGYMPQYTDRCYVKQVRKAKEESK